MISELKDDEILEILMTSDFVENLRPEDYKYLILKFRFFYKILHGNFQRYKTENEKMVSDSKISIEGLNTEVFRLQTYSADLENDLLEFQKPRKLTFSERIKGEIEYKRR